MAAAMGSWKVSFGKVTGAGGRWPGSNAAGCGRRVRGRGTQDPSSCRPSSPSSTWPRRDRHLLIERHSHHAGWNGPRPAGAKRPMADAVLPSVTRSSTVKVAAIR